MAPNDDSGQIWARIYAVGEKLRVEMNWPILDAKEAVHRYLIDKHHWQFEYLETLSAHQVEILLAERMDDDFT